MNGNDLLINDSRAVPMASAQPAFVQQCLIAFTKDAAEGTIAEFKLGVRSLPYLADHGFQDVIVLPGSLYVEMALCVHLELLKHVTGTVRKATFQNPVILSDDDCTIRVIVREQADGTAEYAFYEVVLDDVTREKRTQCCAKLEIESQHSTSRESHFEGLTLKELTCHSSCVLQRDEFYRALRANGNQYGPQFQRLDAVWCVDDHVLGRLSVPRIQGDVRRDYSFPTLVDSIIQLQARFIIDRRRTFVLKSIDRMEIHETDLPDTLWSLATLLTERETGLAGDLDVFDESGKRYLTLSGVTFAYLDRTEPADAEAAVATNICVAATFTAEPLEDSLRFWSRYWGIPTDIKFAPYNQIFQQLLSTGSAFRRNRNGVNVVLLNLEDWMERRSHSALVIGKDLADACFKGHSRFVLPNGLEVVHLNEYETNYVYKEIFEDRCYLRNGIQLRDGDAVIDIGANIGLFSLFVRHTCPNAKVYAFEPSPIVYELLKANCDAYGPGVLAFNCGVSDRAKTARFTFYEKSSVFSGFYSNEHEDKEAIQAVVRNVLRNETSERSESLEEYVDDLTHDRLRQTTFECRMTSVSDIIRENRIDKIGLLKIDAEKSEWDIIRGIEDCHWPMIDQVVVEIHDRTRKVVREIEEILVQKGYRCAVEEETLLKGSGLYNIYASRRAPLSVDLREAEPSPSNGVALQRNISEFCDILTSFMQHSTIPLVLVVCPRTPAAKNDPAVAQSLAKAESELLARVGTLSNVLPIDSEMVLRRYPVADYYDAHSHQLGHIPYTPVCYASIGTTLFRACLSLNGPRYKVIVLDCDNTLWKGVCGEDGAEGVEVTPSHQFLQRFVIEQMQSGAVVCLCSKNNEADVFSVIEKRSDMLLKREHLAAWRINWTRKSDNLKSLAVQLNLQLENFVLIDDNPVECAEVKANCPGVLTLQLPERSELIPVFLNGVWAFDRTVQTDEDRNRTRMYQENAEREKYRAQTITMREFLQGLQLCVEIAEAGENQLSRVSQLSFRTNQFNLTTIRRSYGELKMLLNQGNLTCLTVRVRDRFGDYGLSGVVLYESETNQFKLDTFLLSCRVLGKGVEYNVLAGIGKRAQQEGKRSVEIRFVPSEKNAPALEFLKSIGVEPEIEATGCLKYNCPADLLAGLKYEPDEQGEKQGSIQPDEAGGRNSDQPTKGADVFNVAGKMQRIGDELYEANRIAAAIEEFKLNQKASPVAAYNDASGVIEEALLDIWRRVLSNPHVRVHDNFFEAGGNSLKAVLVITTIRKELKRNISVVTLFECPTVKLLAAKLGAPAQQSGNAPTAGGAERRGQQRRYKKTRRSV
jgi:FkbH-like protein/FkbM family methyltransferase